MSIYRVGRRMFLRDASGVMVAIPTLFSLLPKALAAGPSAKRFVTLSGEIGRNWDWWYPGTNFAPTLDKLNGYFERPFSELAGDIAPMFPAADFNNLKNKMLMLRGLDGLWETHLNGDANHRPAVILAGTPFRTGYTGRLWKQGPSIDQIMAKSKLLYPTDPKVRILNLGINHQQVSYRYSKTGRSYTGTQVKGQAQLTFNLRMESEPAENNPRTLFDRYFKNITTTMPNTPAGPDPAMVRRRLVVDTVLNVYKNARTNTKLASGEKFILDQHIEDLFELESRFPASTPNTPAPVMCTAPSVVGGTLSGGPDRGRFTEDMCRVMAAAIKCGITNIGILELTETEGYEVFSFLQDTNGMGLHSHSHWDGGGQSEKANLNISKWAAKKVGEFVKMLDVVEDATSGSTFLDNSLVLYTDTHADTRLHNHADRPALLFGGLGGKIRTGRYIDYRTNVVYRSGNDSIAENKYRYGRDWNQFLVTIMQAYGLTEADYYRPEDLHPDDRRSAGWGSDEIYPMAAKYMKPDRKNPLPGVIA